MEAGARVYVPGREDEEPWLKGEVWEVKEGGAVAVVRLSEDGSTREVNLTAFGGPLPLQNVVKDGTGVGGREQEEDDDRGVGMEDMCGMDHLHEAAILENLRRRSGLKLPYTYTGPIVLAVNPYEWIDGLYATATANDYLNMEARDALPPHIYATAMTAYRGLVQKGEDQSILVSGESGAGKTESVKIMMNMLAAASNHRKEKASSSLPSSGSGERQAGGAGGTEGAEVVDRVLRSNPLLEAFGNAKTARNDNSSRFGKFQQLEFDPKLGVLVGSHCQTYLLEKSRVVGPSSQAERNYHVFYQLLRGPEEWKRRVRVDGLGPEDFHYLNQGDMEEDTIEGVEDGERFKMTIEALQVVGVAEERVSVMVGALAGILHLGNVELEGDDEKCHVSLPCPSLSSAAELLGCSDESLSRTLCFRTVRAGGEEYAVPMAQRQAQQCRDALSKELYSRLFAWLVQTINRSTAPATSAASHHNQKQSKKLQDAHPYRHHKAKDGRRYGAICLLDIFGFESFQVNSFEQFLINFANETLQQKFCLDIFKGVQAEYDQEGVAWTHIDFKDNAEALALIEGRMGIISVLNEECLRPKGTDASFANKLAALHTEHPHFSRPKFASQDFIVGHYAGEVCYQSHGFLEKNRDTLQEDVSLLLSRSQVGLIAQLFQGDDDQDSHHHQQQSSAAPLKFKRQGSLVAETVSTKFRRQLSTLMSEVSRTEVQYVRCLKPNTLKASGLFDSRLIGDQLRYAGVIEGIRVSRAAYPNRMAHADFLHRFALLLPNGPAATVTSAVAALIPPPAEARCQVGKTRVYFRGGVLEELEDRRTRAIASRVVRAQALWRAHHCRTRYVVLRTSVLLAQSHRRMVLCRRAFLRQKRAALTIQCASRAQAARAELLRRRRRRSAVRLQSWLRGQAQRQAFLTARRGAVVLQARARGRRDRRRVQEMRAEAEEQKRLEGQVFRLKQKLEEELKAREEAEERQRQAVEEAEKRGRETTATADLEETVATLGRLQAENHMLREENETLRRHVAQLKEQMAQLQQHAATQDERLASVLLQLKTQRPAHSIEMERGQHGGTNGYHQHSTGLTVEIDRHHPDAASAQKAVEAAVTPVSPDGEVDRFCRPLNAHWEDVLAESLACLPDPVNVTIKCGRRYLVEDRGMLRWAELSKASGYRDSACFVLEKLPGFMAAKVLQLPPTPSSSSEQEEEGSSCAAIEDYYVLRSRSNRRYVSVGGFFSRSRLRVTERRPEEAALFTMLPVADHTHYHHTHQSEESGPDGSSVVGSAVSPHGGSRFSSPVKEEQEEEGSEDEQETDEGPTMTSGHGDHRRRRSSIPTHRFLFSLLLHQPKAASPAPLLLTRDGYVVTATANNAKLSVGPVDELCGGSVLGLEAMDNTEVYQVLFKEKHLGMTVDRETPLRVVGFTARDKDGRASEAERSGRIRFGDRIISVDDRDLTKLKRSQCIEAIQGQRPVLIGFQTVVSPSTDGSPQPDREQVPISTGRDVFEEVEAFFGGWDSASRRQQQPQHQSQQQEAAQQTGLRSLVLFE